jgi:type IV pilus assembly protein PilM
MADSFFQRIISGEILSNILSPKTESILGLDFGVSSLKIVQLRKEKERAILETYGELSVGHYASVDVGRAAILSEDKMVEMIRDLITESGVKAKDVVASIALKNSFVTVMEMPEMSDKELAEAVPFEARRYIPVPMSEVDMDYWVIPRGFDTNETEFVEQKIKKVAQVLLVAIHKGAIEQYKKVMIRAGLNVKSMEVEVFSAVRASLGRELTPMLFLDIGVSATKMSIVDYGILRSVHSLDKGGQDITLALSRAMGVDFARAEKIKRDIGLSAKPEHKEIREVIGPILDFIFSEAGRMAADYRMKHGRSVSKVVILGGGAMLKGITDATVNKFGVEVMLSNPFAKLDYPAFLEPALREIGPNFATAIGLALREIK